MDRRTLLRGLAAGALPAPAFAGMTHVVGPPGSGPGFVQVLRQARDGDTIEVMAGDYRGEVAVIEQRRLTLRGVGGRPVFHAAGRAAERKAILVVRDGDITIDNLEFRGARVADVNGAGIRFERGRLQVLRCRFVDNENGLLSANFADAELDIEDCVFANAPPMRGRLHHLLYVGRIARLSIVGSRFHQGFEGNLIKSRAARTSIAYNLIVDGAGGRASYEIDLPNGGIAAITGNVLGQSADTENHSVVAYGAEGDAHPRSELTLSHNTMVSDRLAGARFLRVWTDRLPADTRITAVNNLTVGLGVFTAGLDGTFAGNHAASRRALLDPQALDFALAPDSSLRGRGVDPRNVNGRDLAPRAEFVLPIGTRALTPPVNWSPGAFQR